MRYNLYADGACQPNPGIGGWVFLLRESNSEPIAIESGYDPDSTNNRMELMGALKGLEYFTREVGNQPLKIVLDSFYVLEGMRSWSLNWRKYGWQKKNGDPVLNLDLWKQIRGHLDKLEMVEYQLVKGHSGHPENTICDKIAVQEIKKYNAKHINGAQ